VSGQLISLRGVTRPLASATFRRLIREDINRILNRPDMQERLREAGYNVRQALVIVPREKPHGP
jgi:hypothetical protein